MKKKRARKEGNNVQGEDLESSKTKKEKDRRRPKAKKLSPALAALIATKKANRQDVLRGLWVYIKKMRLQDPGDATLIHCDEKMKAVTHKNKVVSTELLRVISDHMFTIEQQPKKKRPKKKPQQQQQNVKGQNVKVK